MGKIIMPAKYAPGFLLSGLTADICIFRNVPGSLGRVSYVHSRGAIRDSNILKYIIDSVVSASTYALHSS